MKTRIQHLLTVLLPGMMILGFALTGLFKPDTNYSNTERRVLAKRPQISSETLLSGKFMNEFETYTQDQFPGRDVFRGLKAGTSKYVFGQKDNHGYYLAKGYLSKLEYPMNVLRLEASLKKQHSVYDQYLKDTDCKVYVSVIPDKNYFLAPECGYPVMDYDTYVEKVRTGASYGKYIDLFNELELDCFYKTDQHWKQESLEKVVKKLADEMQADFITDFSAYEEHLIEQPFYGAYYSQAMLPVKADEMRYLTSDVLKNCIVTSYNTGKAKTAKMYDMEKAVGRDPYEMFVSGSDALVTIENPAVKEEKELILFRDSFGSSLAPLLVDGYSKITLVDLRYIQVGMLQQFLEFDRADVLFLYSTLVF